MAGTEYATKEDMIELMNSNQELRVELNELQVKVDQNEAGKAWQHGAIKTLQENAIPGIVSSIEEINAEIAEIKKLKLIDKQNIDRSSLRLNELEENKIKQMEEKISGIEGQTKDIKDQVNEEIQGIKENMMMAANDQSSPPGLGQIRRCTRARGIRRERVGEDTQS